MTTIATIELNDTLHVHVCDGDSPHVLIERVGAGLVRVEPHEVRHLADVLTLAGGDLAGLAGDAVEVFNIDLPPTQHDLADQYRQATGSIPRGQLWQPCALAWCDNEPVCMNCLRCEEKHCRCEVRND